MIIFILFIMDPQVLFTVQVKMDQHLLPDTFLSVYSSGSSAPIPAYPNDYIVVVYGHQRVHCRPHGQWRTQCCILRYPINIDDVNFENHG
jgi:hypothetical protein